MDREYTGGKMERHCGRGTLQASRNELDANGGLGDDSSRRKCKTMPCPMHKNRTQKTHQTVNGRKSFLSPGSAADDPVGQQLMEKVPKAIASGTSLAIVMAYEGDVCQAKAEECGINPAYWLNKSGRSALQRSRLPFVLL